MESKQQTKDLKIGALVKVIYAVYKTANNCYLGEIGKIIRFIHEHGFGKVEEFDPLIEIEFTDGTLHHYWKEEIEVLSEDRYVIWDEQTGRLMNGTDEKPLSFENCVDGLISYHSIDHDEEELKLVQDQYSKHMNYADISIIPEDEFYFGSY